MSIFKRSWSQLTPEERQAHNERMAKARAMLDAAGKMTKGREPKPLPPVYLRDGKKDLTKPQDRDQ